MRSLTKTRQDNKVTDRTRVVYAENETKLLWLIKPGVDYDENQIGQWHDDYTNVVYVENKTVLSWPIELGAVCDKNKTRQWCDWSYRCSLHQK